MRVVHIEDVPIERQDVRNGWAISEFRIPISGVDGSSTAAFHSIFRSGSTHSKHAHDMSDEIAVYLSGAGVVGQGDSRANVMAGDCRLIPRGSVHFFFNASKESEAVVIGFYLGAPDIASSGYRFCGKVEAGDIGLPRSGLEEGLLISMDDTALFDTSAFGAWAEAKVRLPIGKHNGSSNTLLTAELNAGSEIRRHRLERCEQLHFVVQGAGIASSIDDSVPVRAGHFIFVPKGNDFALNNGSSRNPLHLVGVLTGCGSLAEAGYSSP